MRTQPNLGLRRFISTMAAMSSAEGPFGPGLRRCDEEEKSRRYFRSTKALWNLNNVAGLRIAPSFGNPARAHEQRGQPEHEAIERGQIRRTLSGAIADEQLMLEQQGFCGDGAYATWAEQLREGDQQVNGEDEEFAHGANGTMTDQCAQDCTARPRLRSHYEFATHRFGSKRPLRLS